MIALKIDLFKALWVIAIIAMITTTIVVFAGDKEDPPRTKKPAQDTVRVDSAKTFKRLHYEQMIIQDDMKNKKAELDSIIKRRKK